MTSIAPAFRSWSARRIVIGFIALIVSIAIVVGAGRYAENRAIDDLARQARTAAQLRTALLHSEIERFRLLPMALSDDTDVIGALAGGRPARHALDQKLESLARTTGAATIYLLDAAGTAIAASNWRSRTSFVGTDYAFRDYYRAAVRTGSAAQFARGTVSGSSGLYLSRRTRGGGYLVVKLEFGRIEREWARSGGITVVTEPHGIVLLTSRPEWRFLAPATLPPAVREQFRQTMKSGAGSLRPLPIDHLGRSVVTIAGDDRRWLATSVTAREFGWRLNTLTPIDRSVAAATRLARLATGLALLLLAGLGAALAVRARSRQRRRAAAALRTAELETLVTARTAQLQAEIDERIAVEARADTLREGLRQANRLATLGQITAGIAHETAQPVAAIRSYAANGRQFLQRGDSTSAEANFAAIGRLTERIGAVTATLRGFARKGGGTPGPISLARAIEGATLILRERLAQVTFRCPTLPQSLMVIADMVRLEQVLVNLLQNALEALDRRPDPRLTLSVAQRADGVTITVRDNGPGIDPTIADRLFTPFVTSRATGLGLGLVISQDIMADMGGSLNAMPCTDGAAFVIVLRRD
ncbi:histidine kinase [Sphingomonas sp. Leaf17]|uniref:sensor histidine kinase n=1 Tax=Sphingomonas sp. Leaf17 TaxID=1735683 RepID=UPI0006FB4F92|nr:ATP-binding protein [Sphingomonas sp. Leaf17]KQM65625.1 histidine kinase [Sphingomonas sp. Leaf17]